MLTEIGSELRWAAEIRRDGHTVVVARWPGRCRCGEPFWPGELIEHYAGRWNHVGRCLSPEEIDRSLSLREWKAIRGLDAAEISADQDENGEPTAAVLLFPAGRRP